jgi:hypothetical protein
MRKSQRLRLSALLAKDQKDLSADERSELTTLQALAAQHPDAAQDTDDPASPTSQTSPSSSAASFKSTLIGSLATLRDKAAVGADLVTARAAIIALTTERDQARADLAAAQTASATQATTLRAEITALTAQRDAFAGFFGITVSDLAAKDTAGIAELLKTRISAEATEQIAALGQPMAALPKQTGGNGGGALETLEDLHAQMREEKDLKKLGQLAAKANALRDKLWANN